MNILIISSSPRRESITFRGALFLKDFLEKLGESSVELLDLRDWETGYLQEVWQSHETTPEKFKPLFDSLHNADAILIVTPEYNGLFSPALSAVLDQFPKTTYYRKAFGIVCASTGAMGGMRGAMHLQQYILGLFGIPTAQMLLIGNIDKRINPQGQSVDEILLKQTTNFVHEFLWLGKTLKKGR